MSRDEQRLSDYLRQILQAERIQHYTDDIDEIGFLANTMVQDAVIRNFEVIPGFRSVASRVAARLRIDEKCCCSWLF